MADVEWVVRSSHRDSQGNTRHTSTTFSSHEQYLNSQTVLFGAIDGPTIKFPAGQHSYNFACALPERLPGSLSTDEADIKYKVKLVMDVPWGLDSKESHAFEVRNVIDLNQNHAVKMPVQMEELKSFCLFSCSSQEALVTMYVPQGGYAPNEDIPIQCTITNKTSVSFEGVSFKLRRIVKAISTSPRRSERETKYTEAESEYEFTEDTRNTTTKITCLLKVPECPVSSHFAAYILTDYFIKAEFRVVGCHSDVTLEIPIEIGTIALGTPGYVVATAVPLAPMPLLERGPGDFTQLPSAPRPEDLDEKAPMLERKYIKGPLKRSVNLNPDSDFRATAKLCRSDEGGDGERSRR